MGKRCKPGVFCIEYATLVIFLLLIGIIVYLMYPKVNMDSSSIAKVKMIPSHIFGMSSKMGLSRDIRDLAMERDVLRDPYEPPLKSNLGMPVNIRTQGRIGNYHQTGILTRKDSNNNSIILPLMGREVNSGRDKWNYYTMNDKNTMIKLPVSYKKKSCTNEYGCDNLSNGDTVYVEGYNDTFNVTMYENNDFRYIPYL